MYLKHRSQTHRVEFWPLPWLRPRPPARRSEVRPCERMEDRDTPGIQPAAWGVCELGVPVSSVSDSVSG